jgi:aryl-alcohol dehydrogenase
MDLTEERHMKITAAVVPVRSAPFEIETLDLAAPLADEVLVRVVASGMCHTDLHARDGYFANLPYPVVCGHEGAGIIEQVGAAVADLAPGDPVECTNRTANPTFCSVATQTPM